MLNSILLSSTSLLGNYCSLWEVFTAFFSSMLLSDILGGIWTPEYKNNVTGLIRNMGIPFVTTLEEKLRSQIDDNVKEITGHMHRRAIFMIFFCICLLGLTGAESNLGFTPTNIAEILFWIVSTGVIILLCGAFTFSNNTITLIICLLYGTLFFFLCHYGHQFSLTWDLLSEEKYVIWFLLTFMCIPIIWQMITCWIYSSLFYGKLREELHEEEMSYKMAIIGIKTSNINVVPEKYKLRATIDISKKIADDVDISYESCDEILYSSVDKMLDNPVAIRIFLSWIKHRLKCIFIQKVSDDYEYINEQFKHFSKQVEIPVSELSHSKNSSFTIMDRLSMKENQTKEKSCYRKQYLLSKVLILLLTLGVGTRIVREVLKE